MCFSWRGCVDAVSRLAQEFASLDVRLAEFDVITAELLCDLACAFAQGGANDPHVTRAMRELADEVQHRLKGGQHYFCRHSADRLLAAFDPRDRIQAGAMRQLERLQPQPLALPRPLARPENQACRMPWEEAGHSDENLSTMSGDALSRHAKHLGKRPQHPESQRSIETLVRFLLDARQPSPCRCRPANGLACGWHTCPGPDRKCPRKQGRRSEAANIIRAWKGC